LPWTETTRPIYARDCTRYASDLTDAEWALISPLMPAPNGIGRPRKTDLREVVNWTWTSPGFVDGYGLADSSVSSRLLSSLMGDM